MATRVKKVSYGKIGEVDRISDLPEYILHHILSFIDTKEACRTCILSKKWASVWATVPFLDFQPDYIIKENIRNKVLFPLDKYQRQFYEQDSVDRYVNFIDGTMQRYSRQNLSIKKLKLEMPVLDSNLASFMDRWLRIAVLNSLEELNLSFVGQFSPKYRLPEILFFAKSLKFLEGFQVELPYYQVVKLTSLQTLRLDRVVANEDMLQRIISSSPLVVLELRACYGLKNISVPRLSNIEHLIVMKDTDENLNINQETGSLQIFEYIGNQCTCSPISWEINTGALRNLKELRIDFSDIGDEVFAYLLTELTFLDTLSVHSCFALRNLKISSNRLNKLYLLRCVGLKNVVIDAPNLAFFSYYGNYSGHRKLSLCFTNIQPQCDAYFEICSVYPVSNKTLWFVNLKKFLTKSNICKVLTIVVDPDICMSELNVDELRKILDGPGYDLRELKLSLLSGRCLTYSSVSDFLDGLFFICHPNALSISKRLQYDNTFVELLVAVLLDKVDRWQHPLRNIQVESFDLGKHRGYGVELNFRVKLCW